MINVTVSIMTIIIHHLIFNVIITNVLFTIIAIELFIITVNKREGENDPTQILERDRRDINIIDVGRRNNNK